MPIVNVGDKGNINTEICGKNIMDTKTCYGTYSYGKPKIAVFSEVVFPYRPNVETMGVAYTVSCKKDIEYTMSITNPNPNYAIAIGEYKNMQDATDVENAIGYIEPQQTTKISYKAISNGILVCLLAAKWTDGSSNLHECTESELVQVEIGNTATSYETPKKHTFFALTTPNGLPGIPVDSGGNYTDSTGQQWVCDEIDLARGKYVQRIGEYLPQEVPDARINITEGGITGGKTIMCRYLPKSGNNPFVGAVLCNFLKKNNNIWTTDKEMCSYSVDGHIDFRVQKDRLKTVDVIGVKEFCREIGARFIYALTDFIEHDLTSEEIVAYKALHTNYPTTTVLNDENADMELTYTVDTQSYVDSKIAEIGKAIL